MNKGSRNVNIKKRSAIILISVAIFFLFAVSLKFITNFFANETEPGNEGPPDTSFVVSIGGSDNGSEVDDVKNLYTSQLLDIIDINTNKSIIGENFTDEPYVSFKITLDGQFKKDGIEVRLIPNEWVDADTGKIENEEYKSQYNYHAPLRANNDIYSIKLNKTNSVIWISNIEKSEYVVTFNAENVNIQDAGVVRAFVGKDPGAMNDLQKVTIAFGQSIVHGRILTFSIELNDEYAEEGFKIIPVVKGAGSTAVSINEMGDNENLWKAEGINANTTITFQNIQLRKTNITVTKPENSVIGDIHANAFENQADIQIDYGSNFNFTIYPQDGYRWKSSEFAINITDNDDSSNQNYQYVTRFDGNVWHVDVRSEDGKGLSLRRNTPGATYAITLNIIAEIEQNSEAQTSENYKTIFGRNEDINVQELEYTPSNTAVLMGETITEQQVDTQNLVVTQPVVTIPSGSIFMLGSNHVVVKSEEPSGDPQPSDPKIEGKFANSVTLTTDVVINPAFQINSEKIEFQHIVNSESIGQTFRTTDSLKMDFEIKEPEDPNVIYDPIASQTFTELANCIEKIIIKGTFAVDEDNQCTLESCTADITFKGTTVSYKRRVFEESKQINIPIGNSNSSVNHAKIEKNNISQLELPANSVFTKKLIFSDSDIPHTSSTVKTTVAPGSTNTIDVTFTTNQAILLNVTGTDFESKNFSAELPLASIDMTPNSLSVTSTIHPGHGETFENSVQNFEISKYQISLATISGTVKKDEKTDGSSTTTTTYTIDANSCQMNLTFSPLYMTAKDFETETGTPTLYAQELTVNASGANISLTTNLKLKIGRGTSFTIPSTEIIASYLGDPLTGQPSITAALNKDVSMQTKNDITINPMSPVDPTFSLTYNTPNDIANAFSISTQNPSLDFTAEEQGNTYCSSIESQPFGINNISTIRIHGAMKRNEDNNNYYEIESCQADLTFTGLNVDYGALKILNISDENTSGNIDSLEFDKEDSADHKYILITSKKGEDGKDLLSGLSLELLSGDMAIEKQNMKSMFKSLPGDVFKLSNVKEDCEILKSSSTDNYLYFRSKQLSNLQDTVTIKYTGSGSSTDSEDWAVYPSSAQWGINITDPDTQYQFSIEQKGTLSIENVIVTVPNDLNMQLQPNSEFVNTNIQKFYKTAKKSQVTIISIDNFESASYKITLPNKDGLIFKNALNGEILSGIVFTQEAFSLVLEAADGYCFPVETDAEGVRLFNILTIANNPESLPEVAKIQNTCMMSNDKIINYKTIIYDFTGDVELTLTDNLAPTKSLCKVYFMSPDDEITFEGISGFEGEQVDGEGEPIWQEIQQGEPDEQGNRQGYVLVINNTEFKFAVNNTSKQKILVKSGLITDLQDLTPVEDVYKLRVTKDNTVIKVEKIKADACLVQFKTEDKNIIITEAVKIEADSVNITSISTPVIQGGTLVFKVTPIGKYSQSSPVAKVANKPLPQNAIVFTLSDVQADTTVTISDIEENNYDVMFASNHAAFYDTATGSELGGNGVTIKHEGSFAFHIAVDSGYDIKSATFTISRNDGKGAQTSSKIVTINQALGQYEIRNVQEEVTVNADIQLNQYALSFQQDIDSNNEQKFKILQKITNIKLESANEISIPFAELPENTSDTSAFTATAQAGDFNIINPPTITTDSGNYTISNSDISSVEINGTIKKNIDDSYSISSCKAIVKFNKINGNITIDPSPNVGYNIVLGEDALDAGNKTVTIAAGVQIETTPNAYQDITSAEKLLKYGEQFTFEIELNAKYNKSEINISFSNPSQGRILDLSSDEIHKYQVQIYDNNSVSVNNISLNKYSLSLKQSAETLKSFEIYDSGKNGLLNTDNDFTIVHGQTYSFALKAKYGFEISGAEVYIGPASADYANENGKFSKITESVDKEYYIYTTPKITGDSKIIMNALGPKRYSVEFEGQSVVFKEDNAQESIITDEQKVAHGKPYSFRLYPEPGYNLSNINVVTNTGLMLTLKESNSTYNLYNVNSVKENLIIMVSGAKRNEYQIIFKHGGVKSGDENQDIEEIALSKVLSICEESGNILKSDGDAAELCGTAIHGYNYKFKISLDDKFNRSTISLKAKIANPGQEQPVNLACQNEYWTLPGNLIAGKQITIIVEGIEVNKYSIGFSGEGISFRNDNKVISEWDGDSQEFPTDVSAPTIEHTLNDVSNNSNAHIYQIEITALTDNGYSLDENLRVYISNGIITRDTSKTNQWVYNIGGVTNDTVVYVEGVKSVLYRVEFVDKNSSTQRFKVYNENNKNITSGVRLAHGEDLNFKVILDDAYTQSIIKVYYDKNSDGSASEDEIINVENGFYKLNVTKTFKITISDIAVNKYNIIFNEDHRITFRNASGAKILNYKLIDQSGAEITNYKLTDQSGTEITDYKVTIIGETVSITDQNDAVITGYTFTYQSGAEITDPKIVENKISVEHGGEYSFQVESNTGYNLSSALVSATNAAIIKDDKTSTDTLFAVSLSNITDNSDISVSGITINLYSVTFQNEESKRITNANIYAYPADRDITNGTQTYYNKELKFKIELKEGYTNSPLKVSSSLTPTDLDKGDDGYYTITTPKDTIINIYGIEINKYDITLSAEDDLTENKVTFRETDGSDIKLPSESADTLKGVVNHGSDYSFLAEANEGFTLSDLKVTVGGADVEVKVNTVGGKSQATVTLIGVTKNLSVEKDQETGLITYENPVRISNAKKEKYTVTFGGQEMNNVTILDKDTLKDITRSGREVLYGGDLTIIASPNTGYDQSVSGWTFVAGTAIEKESTNTWKIKNVTSDTIVTLQGLQLNTYTMTFKGDDVEFKDKVTGNDISSQNLSITHGRYFTFKVTPKEGYDLENVTISTTAGRLTEENRSAKEAVYTLSEIDSPPTVEVKVLKSNINVKLVENEGIIYREPFGSSVLIGIQTRPYGDTFSFSVATEYGYDFKTLEVKAEGTVLIPSSINEEEEYYRYEIPSVKEDTDITATVNKKKYKIELPTSESTEGLKFYENNRQITHETNIIVEYGGKFQFTTELDDRHNQSSVTVKANDETVNFINGYYTIADVSANMAITVEGIEINRYKVNLSESIGATYEDASVEMSNISGVYIIQYGSEISFSISPKGGYELSQMVVVCREDNGVAISLEPKDGRYTIKNVASNKTVSVQNAKEVQYKVSFEPTYGVRYKNDQGLVVTNPVYVNHGNNFEFQVSIYDECDDSVPVVKTTSGTVGVQKLSAGKYILSNVTEDLTIQVLNVSKNKYTVTLTKITGITYKDASGKTLENEAQKVEYNDDFKFHVYVQPAYNDSAITVMLGKDNIATENGVYIIRGIKEDKTVTVTGITENEETLLINTIDKLSDKVESSADVDAIVQATKRYNQLSDDKKALISNYSKLQSLQQLAGEYSHVTNDLKVSGVPWNIKLVAVTLSANTDACSRIYNKLNSEFILSLYDIYLVDMLTGQKYELPEGEKVIVTIPTPDLKYFKDPLVVHEISSTGKIEYLILNINGDTSSFEMTSFSSAGVIAKKSLNSGNSSLFNAIGDEINNIKDIIANMVNGGGHGQSSNMSNTSGSSSASGSGNDSNDSWDDSVQSDKSDEIFEESTDVTSNSENSSSGGSSSGSNNSGGTGSNNKNNGFIGQFVQDGSGVMQGSAIKLILILVLGAIIVILVIIVIKRLRPKNKNSKTASGKTEPKVPPKNE
ncbi:MAG: hypothetical protein LBR79_06960 [Oscillospiraceae bacterium]|nr:hypothetical protein [Oscillospiraceae bacterium]